MKGWFFFRLYLPESMALSLLHGTCVDFVMKHVFRVFRVCDVQVRLHACGFFVPLFSFRRNSGDICKELQENEKIESMAGKRKKVGVAAAAGGREVPRKRPAVSPGQAAEEEDFPRGVSSFLFSLGGGC